MPLANCNASAESLKSCMRGPAMMALPSAAGSMGSDPYSAPNVRPMTTTSANEYALRSSPIVSSRKRPVALPGVRADRREQPFNSAAAASNHSGFRGAHSNCTPFGTASRSSRCSSGAVDPATTSGLERSIPIASAKSAAPGTSSATWAVSHFMVPVTNALFSCKPSPTKRAAYSWF